MTFLLVWLSGCDGCRPQLPSNPHETRTDTSQFDETGDTAPHESGPPPMCEEVEVEPNDSVDEIQALPMEVWACGHFDRAFDADWLRFEATETGWLEVDVQAAARGSSADAQLDLINETSDVSLHAPGSYLSTDPKVIVPLTEPGVFDIGLGETQYLYGDDYSWYARASIVKPPIEWTKNEVEPNESTAEATPIEVGDVIYGTISAPDDFDWFKITLSAFPTQYTFNIRAYELGSPVDLTLKLYDADGTTNLRTKKYGEIDYDPDPWMTYRSEVGDTEWYLLVRPADDLGTPYHWYTMTITSTPISE